jgi:RND family efflux transporter MFP subunit
MHEPPDVITVASASRRPFPSVFSTVLVGVVVGGLVLVGTLPRMKRREAMAQTQAESMAPRRVVVARASQGPTKVDLVLPGTVSPLRSTSIFAKTTGFLRNPRVDMGDHVKAGDVLAEVDAPETDEELRLARARLEEAQANMGIWQSNATRQNKLSGDGVVSLQQAEDATARANSATAAIKTGKAELQRLGAIHQYQRIIAPFDGVITRRYADKGAFVAPGAALLFDIAEVSTLRIFVDIPQSLADGIAAGVAGKVFTPSDPAHAVAAKVTRTSGTLDPNTRTLRTELQIPGDGAILSGSFVNVRFQIERKHPTVSIPASTLVVRKDGTQVIRVTDDGIAHLIPITLGRDLGKELEVLVGVTPGDVLITNPPDDLADGQPVRATEPPRVAKP